MTAPAPYRFYAYELSYFSAKVRPALRAKGIWYQEWHADLREILRRTGLAYVPVVITPEDETWQDTSEILSNLEARHPDPPLLPATPLQRLVAHLVELYSDEFALLPAMHYRWGSERSVADARTRFAAMIGDEALAERAAGRMAAARLAVGATPETAAVLEAHTHELIDTLGAHLREHTYLLGGALSAADCALMGPFYGHLYLDIVPRELLLARGGPVIRWIESCNYPLSESPGAWLEGDDVAPTLAALLRVMGRDAAPCLRARVAAYDDWADAHPEERREPPRSVGQARAQLRGVAYETFAGPYSSWMLQRSTDCYAALAPPDRARADALLEGSGWLELLRSPPRHRVTKRGFQVVAGE